MKTITIIGGGNSAHVLIPLLSRTEMRVNLLTRQPERWSKNISLDYSLPSGEIIENYQGKINKISDLPVDVIPESDIIILCMPVHKYRLALDRIASYINPHKKLFIGTVFGQAGFNWMIDEIVHNYSLSNVSMFAFGLIPWICRTKKYGESGIVYGAKPINVAATKPYDEFKELDEILFNNVVHKWFNHGAFKQADNFLSLTLSLDNQIIHTSRLYGLFLEHGGVWNTKEEVPYFYRDFSNESADILKGLDDDYSLIRNEIKRLYKDKKFTYMLDYLSLDNETNLTSNTTILETFSNSKTLGAIKTPVVEEEGQWIIDKNHRFFKDDINYGLCIGKWIAEELDINVPNIDNLLVWAQEILGDKIIENGKLVIDDEIEKDPFKYGVPKAYGYNQLSQIID